MTFRVRPLEGASPIEVVGMRQKSEMDKGCYKWRVNGTDPVPVSPSVVLGGPIRT